MKKMFVCFVLLCTVCMVAFAQNQPASGFDKLKSLAGEWQGKSDEGTFTVSYRLASNGSALVETLSSAADSEMVTVYHQDGQKLAMTHYCAVGNQPRMQADVPAGEVKALDFKFVGGSNLQSATAGHMVGLSITFLDKDHVRQVWTYRENGKDRQTIFELSRKK